MGKQFAQHDSDENVEEFRLRMNQQMNPGNTLVECILQEARRAGSLSRSAKGVDEFIQIQEYIFNVGVEELNDMLARKRKKGRRVLTRRP